MFDSCGIRVLCWMPNSDIISFQNPMFSKLILVHDTLITKLTIDTQSSLIPKYQISTNSNEQKAPYPSNLSTEYQLPSAEKTVLMLLVLFVSMVNQHRHMLTERHPSKAVEESCQSFTSDRGSIVKTFIDLALYIFYNPVFSWSMGSETTRLLLALEPDVHCLF